MFLFLRLLLAHFFGDFVLQFDEVYEVKKKGLGGALIHYFIIFFSFILFSVPYLNHPGLWAVIVFASVGHGVQDEIKLRLVTVPAWQFVNFILDQLIHICFIFPVFLLPFADAIPTPPSPLMTIYNNDFLVILAIVYIVSVFMGTYIWESFQGSYLSDSPETGSFEIKYGMFERFVYTTAVLNWYLAPLFLVPPFLRFFSGRLGFSKEFIFNLVYASAAGLFLRRFFIHF